jgi:type I restriction-modification system DNA methylase subunit
MLVRWVVRSPSDRLLDPACGLAAFLLCPFEAFARPRSVRAGELSDFVARPSCGRGVFS